MSEGLETNIDDSNLNMFDVVSVSSHDDKNIGQPQDGMSWTWESTHLEDSDEDHHLDDDQDGNMTLEGGTFSKAKIKDLGKIYQDLLGAVGKFAKHNHHSVQSVLSRLSLAFTMCSK